ncbi:hypothetical protein [Microbacterium elymi]|uniref:Uncharacterized protein n=1 Tax=Microbacterium elymi TaxID=2909587 RepID=A0ABY5NLN0_9MICO|nr:hypothetical protein [Microbacterium elymi]UUT36093.1 hypothetical protein L2X98_23760 [Microbacterium elymi]
MSTPHRRHSPAVYRRRRLLVLLVLLVIVVAVVWVLIAQPWRGSAEQGNKDAATQSADPLLPSVQNTSGATPSATPTGTRGVRRRRRVRPRARRRAPDRRHPPSPAARTTSP